MPLKYAKLLTLLACIQLQTIISFTIYIKYFLLPQLFTIRQYTHHSEHILLLQKAYSSSKKEYSSYFAPPERVQKFAILKCKTEV